MFCSTTLHTSVILVHTSLTVMTVCVLYGCRMKRKVWRQSLRVSSME